MKSALLSFSTQAEPGAIRRANILKVETLLLVAWLRCLEIGNLGMEVAHLRIVLDTERILLITADSKPKIINANNSVSCRAFKYM